jgi:hypothetical protein
MFPLLEQEAAKYSSFAGVYAGEAAGSLMMNNQSQFQTADLEVY